MSAGKDAAVSGSTPSNWLRLANQVKKRSRVTSPRRIRWWIRIGNGHVPGARKSRCSGISIALARKSRWIPVPVAAGSGWMRANWKPFGLKAISRVICLDTTIIAAFPKRLFDPGTPLCNVCRFRPTGHTRRARVAPTTCCLERCLINRVLRPRILVPCFFGLNFSALGWRGIATQSRSSRGRRRRYPFGPIGCIRVPGASNSRTHGESGGRHRSIRNRPAMFLTERPPEARTLLDVPYASEK